MSKKQKIQCQICGQEFARITQSHLGLCSPGLCLEEYRRIYGPTSANGLSKSAVVKYAGDIAATVVEQIAGDTELMEDIASRVGQHLFSDNTRGKLLGAAMMMLAERSASYKRHIDRLAVIDDEIFQTHRVEAGGPDGAPTDTKTLLLMGKYQSDRINASENALLKLIKTAVEDRRISAVNVNVKTTFTGIHEHLHVPPSFDAKQREALRRLGSRLIRPPKTVQALMDGVKEANTDDTEEEDSIEATFKAVGD